MDKFDELLDKVIEARVEARLASLLERKLAAMLGETPKVETPKVETATIDGEEIGTAEEARKYLRRPSTVIRPKNGAINNNRVVVSNRRALPSGRPGLLVRCLKCNQEKVLSDNAFLKFGCKRCSDSRTGTAAGAQLKAYVSQGVDALEESLVNYLARTRIVASTTDTIEWGKRTGLGIDKRVIGSRLALLSRKPDAILTVETAGKARWRVALKAVGAK